MNRAFWEVQRDLVTDTSELFGNTDEGNSTEYSGSLSDTIRIEYKENRKTKLIAYTIGMEYRGNPFVENVVTSLNYIVENGADIDNIIQESSKNKNNKAVIIKYGRENTYRYSDQTILWNDQWGLRIYDSRTDIIGRRSASLLLFHEMAHFFRHMTKPKEYFKDRRTAPSKKDYYTLEEERAIEDYENPAAIILGEGTRDNHLGSTLKNMESPISTQTKKEALENQKD